MGAYSELLEKYGDLSSEKDKKEILKIFPRKEGKLVFPSEGKIVIPRGRTLVFFNSCYKEASSEKILKKLECHSICKMVSMSAIKESYGTYDNACEIINSIFEDDVIYGLEDGYITVIEDVYTDMLGRAILLKGFEKYYTNVVAITLDYSIEAKGSFIYDMFNSLSRLNEDRRNRLRLGVDFNYIVPLSVIDSLKIVIDKKV